MDILTFRVGAEWYGLDAGVVHRIVEEHGVSPVPMMPPFYKGLLFYRGDLYDVVDLGMLLQGKPAGGSRLMLFRWGHHAMAFLADLVGSIRMQQDPAAGRILLETGDVVHILSIEQWIERIFSSDHGPGKIPSDFSSGIE